MPSRRIWIRRCCRRPGLVTRARICSTRLGRYLAGGAADLVPTAQLWDTLQPRSSVPTVRDYDDIGASPLVLPGRQRGFCRSPIPRRPALDWSRTPCGYNPLISQPTGLGGAAGLIGGAPNPYVFPGNLPAGERARRPRWCAGAPATAHPRPSHAPELVMDSGNNLARVHAHLAPGSPYAIEYVWKSQVGDNTINP